MVAQTGLKNIDLFPCLTKQEARVESYLSAREYDLAQGTKNPFFFAIHLCVVHRA